MNYACLGVVTNTYSSPLGRAYNSCETILDDITTTIITTTICKLGRTGLRHSTKLLKKLYDLSSCPQLSANNSV